MTAAFFIVLIAGWIFFSAWRFYKNVNWEEPAKWTPDYGELRKKEAELDHLQEVLMKAHEAGKLSASCVDEFRRYCEAELHILRTAAEGSKR